MHYITLHPHPQCIILHVAREKSGVLKAHRHSPRAECIDSVLGVKWESSGMIIKMGAVCYEMIKKVLSGMIMIKSKSLATIILSLE